MKYGFIGLGNMAGAIIEGMAASGKFEAGSILGFNRSPEKTMALAEECGLIPCESASDLVGKCDVIILAVKPQVMPEVMEEIGASVSGKQTVLTIAAGKNTAWYEERFENKVPVVRIMPNINAKVKMAVSGVCGGCFADEESIKIAYEVFSTVGSVYHIEEKLFLAFSALGGASGAFVLLYIDALAEAGVRAGFSRPIAEEIAAATAVGSATLCMADGAHPIAIMNRICSPGGTTVEGVIKLRELGFETAVQQGLQAIIDKDSRL